MAIDYPASPTHGQVYLQYIYDSTIPGWRNSNSSEGIGLQFKSGLIPVIPTSVNVNSGSATVAADGTITFSGMSTIGINGCFSAAFRNYRFVLSDLQASNPNYPGITFLLRNAGTNVTTEYWNWGVRAVSSAGITQRGANSTSGMEIVSTIGWGGKYAAVTADVNTPFIASNTTILSSAVGFDASSALWQSQSCFKNDTSSYDGMSFTISSGTAVGTLKIYGYN